MRKIFGALLCALTLASLSAASAEDKQPNVLFVLADDQSWLHTSKFGDKVVKTPTFDRIADEGLMFTHSFTAAPSCTASRSAILTGQDIWRIKQAGVLFGSIPPEIPLVTHMLEDNGYHVGMTGKGWAPGNWGALGLKRRPTGKEYNMHGSGHVAEGIDRRDYAKNFKEFLKDRKADQPFFFWFGSTEPHRIYQYKVGEKEGGLRIDDVDVPPFWPDVEKVRHDILDYYYEIEWMDTHLESMIADLEEIGELDNTIIIVTSDNGMPFPRAKTTLYDWGTRMPLAIRYGKNIKNPGRWIDDFVMHTDFAPTILDLAGIDIPAEMTGRSLVNIMQSSKAGIVEPERDMAVTATERHTWTRPEGATYPMRAIRTREYLYIRNYEPGRWPTGGPDFISSNKTTHGDIDAAPTKEFLEDNASRYPAHYEWNMGKRPAEELYKIADDPGQINNLAGDPSYSDIKENLRQQLENHLRETGDPRMNGEDPWQEYIYHQVDGFGQVYNKTLSPSRLRRAKLRPGN